MRQQAFFEPQEAGGAATAAPVLGPSRSREFIQLQNTGSSAWKFRFGALPDANNGFTLQPGGTATYDYRVPNGPLYLESGAAFYVMWG